MARATTRRLASATAALTALASLTPGHATTTTIDAGWDLFESSSGTMFDGVAFQGVPLNTFNFGGAIGTKNVGGTDTILQRTTGNVTFDLATGASISTAVLALQLRSVNLVSGQYEYLTLDGTHTSTGTLTINPGGTASGGTFNSTLDIFFDLRQGSLTGTLQESGELQLSANGTLWSRTPPAGAVTIPGVNQNLNGTDNAADFWTIPVPEITMVINPNVTLPPGFGGPAGFSGSLSDSVPDATPTLGLLLLTASFYWLGRTYRSTLA